jgi:glucose/arabinose dehydrogenase
VVNERDEIGSDLVPDYLTSVPDGSFFGWPYSYFGQHLDGRVQPGRPDLVAQASVPDYALGPHTASLGLAFSNSTWPAPFDTGVFIGQHGSWNRKPRSGYRVIFVPFRGGKPFGAPIDVLTGFLSADGDAFGRPVGVALDSQSALLVADDVGNTVWRVTASTKPRPHSGAANRTLGGEFSCHAGKERLCRWPQRQSLTLLSAWIISSISSCCHASNLP